MNLFIAMEDDDNEYVIFATAASSSAEARAGLRAYEQRENEGVEWNDEDDCYVDEDGDEVSYFDQDYYSVVEIVLERVS